MAYEWDCREEQCKDVDGTPAEIAAVLIGNHTARIYLMCAGCATEAIKQGETLYRDPAAPEGALGLSAEPFGLFGTHIVGEFSGR